MAIDKINPFMMQQLSKVNPAFGAVQPIKEPLRQAGGSQSVDPVFTQAVQSFSQKSNPFAAEKVSFGSSDNHKNGLSPLAQGPLGENALYTKNGRLGKNLNLAG